MTGRHASEYSCIYFPGRKIMHTIQHPINYICYRVKNKLFHEGEVQMYIPLTDKLHVCERVNFHIGGGFRTQYSYEV